jgi:hypothetical protein
MGFSKQIPIHSNFFIESWDIKYIYGLNNKPYPSPAEGACEILFAASFRKSKAAAFA